MAINSRTLAAVLNDVTRLTTTETEFRQGLEDIATQVDANEQNVPVEANPTGTPSATLETIDIDGTVYSLAGGIDIFSTSESYSDNDLVISVNRIFRANGTIAASTTEPQDNLGSTAGTWVEVSADTTERAITVYDNNTAYAANSFVVSDDRIWIANAAVASSGGAGGEPEDNQGTAGTANTWRELSENIPVARRTFGTTALRNAATTATTLWQAGDLAVTQDGPSNPVDTAFTAPNGTPPVTYTAGTPELTLRFADAAALTAFENAIPDAMLPGSNQTIIYVGNMVYTFNVALSLVSYVSSGTVVSFNGSGAGGGPVYTITQAARAVGDPPDNTYRQVASGANRTWQFISASQTAAGTTTDNDWARIDEDVRVVRREFATTAARNGETTATTLWNPGDIALVTEAITETIDVTPDNFGRTFGPTMREMIFTSAADRETVQSQLVDLGVLTDRTTTAAQTTLIELRIGADTGTVDEGTYTLPAGTVISVITDSVADDSFQWLTAGETFNSEALTAWTFAVAGTSVNYQYVSEVQTTPATTTDDDWRQLLEAPTTNTPADLVVATATTAEIATAVNSILAIIRELRGE